MDFQSRYDRNEFLKFLRNDFLGEKFKEHVEQTSITKEFKSSFFTSITKLGVVEEFDNLIVLEIEHKSKNDARISLTKDIFKLLRQFELEGLLRQNALVILKNSDTEQYRFSLLTTTYNEDFEEKLSNPKRYSFLLGKGEKTKTPTEYLIKKGKVSSLEKLIERFNVEVVRKEFFNDYLNLYIRLYKAIIDDKDFVLLLKTQKVEIVSFTKNLLGKIVFLYFIQKKGWLGVKLDGEYGKDGDKNFMRSFWDSFKSDKKTVWENTGFFYNDYLEHLFYEGLNKDNRDDNDLSDYFDFKVPYLNGGLFKKDYEKWNKNESKIINDIFSNKTDTFEGNGILDIFDTYNFTIDEDDLYDSDIAIDPEMLGRIFEKMISISEDNIDEILTIYESKNKLEIGNELNKKFGAFYTPREIVHYMTKESIISYLVNNLPGKRDEKENQIRILFDVKEKFLLNEKEFKDNKLSEETFNQIGDIIEEIDILLKKVKILDPAIGSGAFPMGILHEISTIRYYIYGVFFHHFNINFDEFKNEDGRVSMYKIKRDIIKNSIYGVDISSGAIDIARLRFWLSLVVDEEKPEPLPNFEFKFVCANTLIPLADEPGQTHLEFEKELKVETLRKYMGLYYNADSNKEKDEYKALISKYLGFGKNITMDFGNKSERTKQLETYEPFNSNHSAEFFDPSLMMGNGKFDIVIGNPPYIDSETMVKKYPKERDIYSKIYETTIGNWDIYIPFIEKSIKLGNSKGITTMIIPNKVLTIKYAKTLRDFIWDSFIAFCNCSKVKIFENADVDPIILILDKNKSKFINNYSINKNKEIYFNTIINKNNILNNLWGQLLSDNIILLQKLLLNKSISINSENPFSTSEAYELIEYINNDKLLDGFKLINTGTIGRFNNLWGEKETTYLKNKYLFPKILNKDILNNFSEKRFLQSKSVKIIITGMRHFRCFLDIEGKYVAGKSTLIIKGYSLEYLKYLIGILNSKVISFYIKESYSSSGIGGGINFTTDIIKDLPIIDLEIEKQKPFIELVDRILDITKQSFYDPKNPPKEQKDLEDEIDKMVYELYGLNEEEVIVVEESLK